MAAMTAEQRIERAVYRLMSNKVFCLFSGLVMIGKISVVDDHPTACTNGRDIKFGREFVDTLNDKQLLFVLLHELMHMAYRHTVVWKGLYDENAIVANMACDYVINLQIQDMDKEGDYIEFPRDEENNILGLVDEKYRGMDAKQVFNAIKKEFDIEKWFPVRCKRGEEGDEKGKKPGSGKPLVEGWGPPEGGSVPSNIKELLKKQFDEHDFEDAQSLSDEEKEELERKIDQALRQGAQLAGRLGGDLNRGIQELLAPKVDWRQATRDWVKQIFRGRGNATWRRYNKRFIGNNIYMPHSVDERMGRLLEGIDTSGSIGDDVLTAFLSETKSIIDELNPDGLDLLYWDTRVASHEQYDQSNMSSLVESTKPAGGGGTDPACVPAYMKQKGLAPVGVIMLTDGYFYDGDGAEKWGELGVPVLWCVVNGNPNFVPTYGTLVNMEDV